MTQYKQVMLSERKHLVFLRQIGILPYVRMTQYKQVMLSERKHLVFLRQIGILPCVRMTTAHPRSQDL